MSKPPAPEVAAFEAAAPPDSAVPTVALSAREYDDFRLLIEGGAGQYRASVVESPAGESPPTAPIAWSQPIIWLQKESDLRATGAALFNAFAFGQIRELYRVSTALAKTRGRGLRIKLLIDAPELSAQPWELLYDSDNRCHVGLSSSTAIVRHRRIPQPVAPLAVQLPLRILGMIANPLDPNLRPLDVARERKVIETALADLRDAGLVHLEWLESGSWADLQKAMWQPWHVFHYIGHGDYDPAREQGFVILEDAGGGSHRLLAEDLAMLLSGPGDVRLAVLNSCKGSAGDGPASASSMASALVATGMPAVVAMQNPISDKAAITFARVLYLGLASGLPLEAAVGSARAAMKIEHTQPIEWWTPVLHLRAHDGVLFQVPSAVAESHHQLPGMQYLGPDVDAQVKRAVRRERRLRRAVFAWMLSPLPVIGFLGVSPSPSVPFNAEVEASGATFTVLSSPELFSEPTRVRSLGVTGFESVLPSDAAFPIRPTSAQEPVVGAETLDEQSRIVLQPWRVPAGAEVGLDHPPGARPAEYVLGFTTDSGKVFSVTLNGMIGFSLLGAAAERRDFEDDGSLRFTTSKSKLTLDLQFLQPESVTLPAVEIRSLDLTRKGVDATGPVWQSTVMNARVVSDGRDTVNLGPGTYLGFDSLRSGTLTRFRLVERGLTVTLNGRAQRIQVGGVVLPMPSRLESLTNHRLWLLGLGFLGYILVLAVGILSWRTSHAPSAAK